IAAIKADMVEIEQRGIVKLSAEDQRATEGPERQKVLDAKLAATLEPADLERHIALQAERDRLEAERKSLPRRQTTLSVAKCLDEPPETFVLLRGSPHSQGDAVEPHFPSLFGDETPELPPAVPGSHSSGRRLVLANWFASPDNILTA